MFNPLSLLPQFQQASQNPYLNALGMAFPAFGLAMAGSNYFPQMSHDFGPFENWMGYFQPQQDNTQALMERHDSDLGAYHQGYLSAQQDQGPYAPDFPQMGTDPLGEEYNANANAYTQGFNNYHEYGQSPLGATDQNVEPSQQSPVTQSAPVDSQSGSFIQNYMLATPYQADQAPDQDQQVQGFQS